MKLVLLNLQLGAEDNAYNLNAIEKLISTKRSELSEEDVVLLPEHFTSDDSRQAYTEYIRRLAQLTGCTVVGGSHPRLMDGKRLNVGCVMDAKGNELGLYTKLRPYFQELQQISSGNTLGEFKAGGINALILVCADFWYSDIFLRAHALPDIVLVPSLSVSRKPGPEYSRALWRHLAITRAYEFGVFVGISDWGEGSSLPKYRTCGVGGFADPTGTDPEKFFRPVSTEGISIYELEFEKLEGFRADRKMRGFFWK